MLKKSCFTIDNVESFDGYHHPGSLWNGWEQPYFEWEVAQKITLWISSQNGPEELQINIEMNSIVVQDDSDASFEIIRETMSTEDGEKVLYALGTGWWVWDIFRDE
jgi:hypothetical protein